MKTTEEVYKEWNKKVEESKRNNFLLSLNNLSAGDKKVVETLAQLDDMSNGRLAQLYQVYKAIKFNSK